MTLDGAVLEIDFTDAATQEQTAVFEMTGNIQIDEGVRPNFLLDDFGEGAVAVAESATFFQTRRRAYTIDAGAGEHTFDISFRGWEGSDNEWGVDGHSTFDGQSQDALKQVAIFNQVLSRGTTDSFNPARLYVGEYDDGTYGTGSVGIFADEAPLYVQVDGFSGNVTAQDGKRVFNGSLSLSEVNKLAEASAAIEAVDDIIDGTFKLEF